MDQTTYLLGKIIKKEDAERDAVHIAVAPMVAAERLYPGQHIGLTYGSGSTKASSRAKKLIGVVDPFLDHHVESNQRFWMFLYPMSITSLRHKWTHPDFGAAHGMSEGEEVAKDAAERWMRSYADQNRVEYDELLRRAAAHVESGDYWSEGGRFEGMHADDEFWNNYEHITGSKVEKRGGLFSCAC